MKENWPNFFIVGAPKAGTTSLYWIFRKIPEIYMSPVKELNFFCRDNLPEWGKEHSVRDRKNYENLFKNVKDEKIIGEASPSYLGDSDAPHLIHQDNPKSRILISLRDPVDRLYSDYFMAIRAGLIKSSFRDSFVKLNVSENEKKKVKTRLKIGFYSEYVKRYFDVFGRDQVKVIIFEEFVKDQKKTVENILRFLGVDTIITEFKEENINKFANVRGPIAQYIIKSQRIKGFAEKILSPNQRKVLREKILIKDRSKLKMDEKDRDFFIQYYKEDVKKLEILLGRKLPWENFFN